MLPHSKKLFILTTTSMIIIVVSLVYQINRASVGISQRPSVTVGAGTLGFISSIARVKPLSEVSGVVTGDQASSTPIRVVVPKPPSITAESYLVGNLVTGEIYASNNVNLVTPIASISKLITALATERLTESAVINASSTILITEDMLAQIGDEGHLTLGEEYTPAKLMYPLLLESSNDAAYALATSTGYSQFIAMMNDLAHEIGMSASSFDDPSGLSEKNISTASDLFALSRYLFVRKPDLLKFTRLPSGIVASTTKFDERDFVNTNPFIADPHYLGGKTGRTEAARETMLSLFQYSVGGRTYPIAVIVLRSNYGARQNDADLLFEKFFDLVD